MVCSIMAASSLKRARSERSLTPGDVLYEALEDLERKDFKRFKDKLSDFSYGGRRAIPRGRLELADGVSTKNLLIDAYGEEDALEVAIQVLEEISFMGPAEDLRRNMTRNVKSRKMSPNMRLEDCKLQYISDMRKKYHHIEENNARIGESVNMKKIYTSLLLIEKHRDEVERQHELRSTGQRHLQLMANRSSEAYFPTTLQALLDPDVGGNTPKIVVLQGPAGIGKTMTSQKIMLEWAFGNLYKDKFQFIFYMSCREVNAIACEISLASYVSRSCGLKCSSDVLQSIFVDSETILFIVDGFDELKFPSMNNTEVCDDPFQEVSKEVLLNSLLRKKLLTESSLIITTRQFSMMKLKGLVKCSRYVEILGFTGKDRKEYFYNFFESSEQADLVFSVVNDNDTLFTMCVVPITCWIICTVMKPLLKSGLSVVEARTPTSIYLLYLKGLLKFHGRNSVQPTSTCIRKLCALAKEGVWDQRIMFEKSDFERHGLSMSELESVFLNESVFHTGIDTKTCYSFIHLSVQEFFAALYYVLEEKSETMTKVMELLKASEDQAHLTLTVRFLFGLSSDKQIQEAQRTIGCPIAFGDKPILEEWLKRRPSHFHNEILSCLYETQDEDYVGRMMAHFPNLEINVFPYGKDKEEVNISCRTVVYCLGRSTTKHKVSFMSYKMGPKARSLLSKALSKCSRLRFLECRFPDTEEDLPQTESSLSGLLKHCQVEKLKFKSCGLTSSCCDDLRSVLMSSRSLIRLVLSRDNLQDSGVKLLCEGLRHPDCTLQGLKLQNCGLTPSGCDDLRSVIITNHCLVRLDLTWNTLTDPGVKLLCEGLIHPDCTLQEFRLRVCSLTSYCCEHLHPVIATNRSLTSLDLSGNTLKNSGVKLLCKGLRNPDSTLQELMLQACDLTSSCCEYLRFVITTNRSLKKLNLAGNKLQDCGIKILCEGLRHPDCTLQELMLWECGLTSSGCDDLRTVIAANRKLMKLNLSVNKLQDVGMKLLCEGLRHPDCTLQELRVHGCGLTSSCSDDLCSVIAINRSLIKLDLSGNQLQDCVKDLLCETVRHPDCTVQNLT